MSTLLVERPNAASYAQKDRYLAFAFAAADLLVEVVASGKITFAAGAFKARFGLSPEQLVGSDLGKLFVLPDRSALDLALATTVIRGRLPPLVLRLADSAATPMVISGLVIPTAPGRLCLTIGRLPALPDPTPALLQSVSFARLVEERLQSGETGSLGLLELAGWAATQEALPIEIQRTLQAEIMEVLSRLGGPGAVAGEIGTGRYGVMTDAPHDLGVVAHELEALLRTNPVTARTQVQSAELALERDGLTGAQAARALRFALARFADGGTRATNDAGFSHGLAEFIASAQIRARSVRTTLAENRFRLVFQPIVNLDTREVHHYEALIRPTITPGNALQSTQDFVTFAEAVGLSEELDWAVMQQAVAALRGSPNASVAVNVSGLSMQSPAFCDRLTKLLAKQPVPGRILVELTETADIDDVASASATIDRLRAMKVQVCIDDFGSGAAAFRYLREFRTDYVKLDGAYVRGALHNAREHGFLLNMIELANFVGAKVIAEMIEHEDQAHMMRDLGVEYGQGWLFGKPGVLPGSLKYESAS